MTLSYRDPPYIIPEYSLTGDLLSYQVCPLQYRYHNRGALPPSKPVQLWFGEFIHGMMEESYIKWGEDSNLHRFPWDWSTQIRPLELEINRRLNARGLFTPRNLLCQFDSTEIKAKGCKDNRHPHKKIASQRAEAAINIWGRHLYPIVEAAEVKLKGSRELHSPQNRRRSDFYGITGIADVISSISLQNADPGNKILHYLTESPEIQRLMDENDDDEFEIIIDYKGMRRPPIRDNQDHENLTWLSHEWQILTYSWLRSKQPGSKKPIAGILFYLDELYPAIKEIEYFQKEIREHRTDIIPTNPNDITLLSGRDRRNIRERISLELREKRSIRIIAVTDDKIQRALDAFDNVVAEIENSVVSEMESGQIKQCWHSNSDNPDTCTLCDSRFFCQGQGNHFTMTVP